MDKWGYSLLALAGLLMIAGISLIIVGHLLGKNTTGYASASGSMGVITLLMTGLRAAIQKRTRSRYSH